MMGKIPFTKMHGAGNDFIMIEDLDERFDPDRGLIAALCSRHRGIGADGLILIRPGVHAAFSMLYFNSDGGGAELCGNGARCTAFLAHHLGIARRKMAFETSSGPVYAQIMKDGVRVDIGCVTDLEIGVEIPTASDRAHFARAGVPHAVMFVDDVRSLSPEDFLSMTRPVRSYAGFQPEGVNVDLVTVAGPHDVVYRTFERGVETETLACGTGAVAVSVVAAHLGMTAAPVACSTSGGDSLRVTFELTGDGAEACRLEGPAEIAFTGTFERDRYLR